MVIQAPQGAAPLEYPCCAKRLAIAKHSDVNRPKTIGSTAKDLVSFKDVFRLKCVITENAPNCIHVCRRFAPLFAANLCAGIKATNATCPGGARTIPTPFGSPRPCCSKPRSTTVIPYYEKFLEHFPTVDALARAPLPQVLRLWSGLGYYRRAANLKKAAQQIVREHGGKIPQDFAQLERWPVSAITPRARC